jgi:transketolase
MDMRDAVFDEIYDYANLDENIVLVVADADAFGVRKFKKDFPDRFFNVGVAEQNMINVACGLAMNGKMVFVCSLAPFATFRCFEQIKVNMCLMDLPVCIVGLGIGLSFGFDGPTHHTTCDIGVMSNLPELSIYNPSDAYSAGYCVREVCFHRSPSYIRVDKGEFKSFYDSESDLTNGFSVIQEGSGTDVVISTGICSQYAMSYRHSVKVIDLFKIKPINRDALLKEIIGKEKIFTYEEHVGNSGIGSVISNIVAEEGLGIKVKKIALPEEQCFINGDREYLHEQCKIDYHNLKKWTGHIT